MNGLKSFMYGRYGWDKLNWLIFAIAILLGIISRSTLNMLVTIIALGFVTLCMFRALSKNVTKRYDENYKFVNFFANIGKKFNKTKIYVTESKTHHHLKCPSCKQKLKVPRGRGKIEIICPKCKTTFYKET